MKFWGRIVRVQDLLGAPLPETNRIWVHGPEPSTSAQPLSTIGKMTIQPYRTISHFSWDCWLVKARPYSPATPDIHLILQAISNVRLCYLEQIPRKSRKSKFRITIFDCGPVCWAPCSDWSTPPRSNFVDETGPTSTLLCTLVCDTGIEAVIEWRHFLL